MKTQKDQGLLKEYFIRNKLKRGTLTNIVIKDLKEPGFLKNIVKEKLTGAWIY